MKIRKIGMPTTKKKHNDPSKLRSILAALLRMKFIVRRWVKGK